jgi:hypothetical protein
MAATPTLRELVLRIVAEAFPVLVYGAPRTYVVQAVRADGRLDLSPPPDAVALPELVAVEPWVLNGATVVPTPGTEVVVVFRDASPARPVVVGYAQGVAAGGASPNATRPTRLELDASATVTVGENASAVELAGGGPAVARVGDTAGRLIWDQVTATLYHSPSQSAPYAPVAPNPSSPLPPVAAAPGTSIALDSGSSKATCG